MKTTCLIISIAIIACLLFFPCMAAAQQGQPENPVVQEAVIMFRGGDVDGALELLNEELGKTPNDAELHNALGVVYLSKKMHDEALEHFDTAIALEERNYKAINNKLSLLMGVNKADEAIRFLGAITAKYPDWSTGWANKAALEMQQRRFDDAITSVNKAIALDDNDFDAYFKRGQVYLLQRDYSRAEADFDKVLSIRPDFEQAKRGKQIISEFRSKLADGYIRVRQIIVRDADLASDLLSQLKAGADFTELAVRHSVDATAANGGALGLVKKGGLIAELEEAMFSLQPGELSEVVRSPMGYHIFLREE